MWPWPVINTMTTEIPDLNPPAIGSWSFSLILLRRRRLDVPFLRNGIQYSNTAGSQPTHYTIRHFLIGSKSWSSTRTARCTRIRFLVLHINETVVELVKFTSTNEVSGYRIFLSTFFHNFPELRSSLKHLTWKCYWRLNVRSFIVICHRHQFRMNSQANCTFWSLLVLLWPSEWPSLVFLRHLRSTSASRAEHELRNYWRYQGCITYIFISFEAITWSLHGQGRLPWKRRGKPGSLQSCSARGGTEQLYIRIQKALFGFQFHSNINIPKMGLDMLLVNPDSCMTVPQSAVNIAIPV